LPLIGVRLVLVCWSQLGSVMVSLPSWRLAHGNESFVPARAI